MAKYAQINTETGIVTGESWLRDEGMEKDFPELIAIPEDFCPLGKRYDAETKSFVEHNTEGDSE